MARQRTLKQHKGIRHAGVITLMYNDKVVSTRWFSCRRQRREIIARWYRLYNFSGSKNIYLQVLFAEGLEEEIVNFEQ